MATSAEQMCYLCPPPFRLFLETVTNMKFDEEPNYAKLIALFDTLIEPCSALRAIRIDGALKVITWAQSCLWVNTLPHWISGNEYF